MAQFSVCRELFDRSGQALRVLERHQQSGLTVRDRLATSAYVRGDDGKPAGRRLHGGTREPLTVRRQHEHVESLVDLLHLLPAAGEDDSAPSTGVLLIPGSNRVRLLGVGTPDDHEEDVRTAIPEPLGRGEQFPEPLLPDQASDRADHHDVLADTQVSARTLALLRRRLGTKSLEFDTVSE